MEISRKQMKVREIYSRRRVWRVIEKLNSEKSKSGGDLPCMTDEVVIINKPEEPVLEPCEGKSAIRKRRKQRRGEAI